MKQSFILFLIILWFFPVYSQTGTLEIVITGITDNNGDIKAALYNSSGKNGFLKDLTPAFRKTSGRISNQRSVVKFSNLPYGEYAVSLFHDKNLNSDLDRATLGFPIEPYGVSGNVESMGPPKYDDCKFEFNTSYRKITIQLQTWGAKKTP